MLFLNHTTEKQDETSYLPMLNPRLNIRRDTRTNPSAGSKN